MTLPSTPRARACRRLLAGILALAAGAAPALASASAAGAAHVGGIEIALATGTWPPAEAAGVLSVLAQTAAALLRHVDAPPARLVVAPAAEAPRVLYRGDAGAPFQVRLTGGYGRWPQLVYEFGHELCHVLTRFDAGSVRRAPHHHQWFEEALCEAVGLYALQALAREWSDPALGADANAHARRLHQYAALLRGEDHRRLPPHVSLASWYAAQRARLAGSPYHRTTNEVVANALLAYFEADPDRWGVIVNLNDTPEVPPAFRDYLQQWCDATPEAARPTVMHVMRMLGLPAAADARTAAAERPRSAAAR